MTFKIYDRLILRKFHTNLKDPSSQNNKKYFIPNTITTQAIFLQQKKHKSIISIKWKSSRHKISTCLQSFACFLQKSNTQHKKLKKKKIHKLHKNYLQFNSLVFSAYSIIFQIFDVCLSVCGKLTEQILDFIFKLNFRFKRILKSFYSNIGKLG